MTDKELNAIMEASRALNRADKRNKYLPIKYTRKEPKYDSIYTMSDGAATFLYIVVMLIGAIFNDRIWIWFAATLVFVLFKTRHKRRKK